MLNNIVCMWRDTVYSYMNVHGGHLGLSAYPYTLSSLYLSVTDRRAPFTKRDLNFVASAARVILHCKLYLQRENNITRWSKNAGIRTNQLVSSVFQLVYCFRLEGLECDYGLQLKPEGHLNSCFLGTNFPARPNFPLFPFCCSCLFVFNRASYSCQLLHNKHYFSDKLYFNGTNIFILTTVTQP